MLAFLIFIISSLAVFWPVLFGGQIIADHYASQVHYPIFSYFGESLRLNNQIPLWINQYLSGFPTWLSQQGGFLYPITILFFKFLEFPAAYHWLTFFNFTLAGFFMYVLARSLALSRPASVVSGAAYAFSQIGFWLGGQMPALSNFYPFIPLIFLSVIQISRGKKFYILIGGIITGLVWLGGFTESVFYAVISAFFFALYLDIALIQNSKFKIQNLGIRFLLANFKATKCYIVAAIIGAVLASSWLLPVYNFTSLTPRSGGVMAEESVESYSSLGQYLYSSVFPFLNIGPEGIRSFVLIGFLFYLLAFFAFFAARQNRFSPYFIGLFIFTFLVFFKPSQVYDFIHSLPFFKFFYGSWKWAFMSNFALAMLAGFGLDSFASVKDRVNFKLFVRFIEVSGAIFLIFALLVSAWSLTSSNDKFLVSAFFIILSILLFSIYQRNFINFSEFKKLAAIILVLNFVLGWQAMFAFMPRDTYLSPPKTIAFLKDRLEDENFRIIGSAIPENYIKILEEDRVEALKYELAAGGSNQHILYGISSAAGNEAFNTRRHHKLINAETPSLLSMQNVKYILSSFELPPPLKKVFETKTTKYNIPVYIYENSDVLPRVYFAQNAVYTFETNEEKLFEELLKIKDFKKNTLIECSEPLCLAEVIPVNLPRQPATSTWQVDDPEPKPGFGSGDEAIAIQELKNGYLKLQTKTKSPGWLVYSESNLPTWEARIKSNLSAKGGSASGGKSSQISNLSDDNKWKPLKIYTANYIYQAVFVPAGEHEIEFRYPGVFEQMKYAIKKILNSNI
jgi:hypothetical protein